LSADNHQWIPPTKIIECWQSAANATDIQHWMLLSSNE